MDLRDGVGIFTEFLIYGLSFSVISVYLRRAR